MRRLLLSFFVVLLLPAWVVFAADEEGASEVWHFRKGASERTVDVTDLAEVVREVVLRRLAADGYERVPEPARGRDLAADARELVAHGGRFPVAGGHPSTDARPGADALKPPKPPGIQGRLLGAPVRLESGGEAVCLRVLGAPEGSLARALGLARGDRILALDGRVPTAASLARHRTAELAPGQLAVRVLRREGRIEDWTLAFHRGAPPAGR